MTSIAYDTHRDEFLATGTAYANEFGIFPGGGPRCLVATLENGRLGRFRRDSVRVSHRRAIAQPQVCTSAVVLDDPGDAILVGYHPVTTAIGEKINTVKAMLVTVDYFGETLTPDVVVRFEEEKAISYPIATTHDGSTGVFTALHQVERLPAGMVQDATDPLAFILQFKDEATSTEPNPSDGIWKPKVQKVNAQTGAIEWSTDIELPGARILLSSLVYDTVEQVLFVAGSKRPVLNDWDPAHWNGFVLKLDGATGAPLVTNVASDVMPSIEVESQTDKDDYIHCICLDGENNGDDESDAIYAIGTTEGKIDDESPSDGGAFIRKLNKSTFAEIWTRQMAGLGIEGSVCAAHDSAVYMGGQVPDNGKRNVFLSQLSSNGDTRWSQQVGTSLDEYVVEVVIDKNGRPLLAGNSEDRTNGRNDLFFIVFETADGKNNPRWTNPNAQSTLDNDKGKNKQAIIAVSIAIPVFLVLLIICFERSRRKRNGKEKMDLKLPEGDLDHDLALEPSIKISTDGETKNDDDASVVSTTTPRVV